MEEYLKELNEAQVKAVINYEGPALIIAGAGAGKTRVLTYRIAHLLKQGIPAPQHSCTHIYQQSGKRNERKDYCYCWFEYS